MTTLQLIDDYISLIDLQGLDDLKIGINKIRASHLNELSKAAPKKRAATPKAAAVSFTVTITRNTVKTDILFDDVKKLEAFLKLTKKNHTANVDKWLSDNKESPPVYYSYGPAATRQRDYNFECEKYALLLLNAGLDLNIIIKNNLNK